MIFLIYVAVDGRGAGSGNLEILVNGGHVTSHVEEAGAQRFIASFVPHEPMSHRVEMSFNGYPVPGKHPAPPFSEPSTEISLKLHKKNPSEEIKA